MITLFRFSETAFKPCYQIHLINKVQFSFSEKEFNSFNDYQKKLILSSLEKDNVDPNFDFNGVFAFLKKPNLKDYNYYLNHLKNKPDFYKNLHSLDLEEEKICYIDDGFPYRKTNKTTIKDAFKNGYNTIYIPSYSLI